MNDFYQQFITDKSYLILQTLKKQHSFVLIGGWAVYLYTNALKSKDIDIIIDFSELEKMREQYPLSKNERLKKYEIKLEEIDIDIYLPHYSELGLPVQTIMHETETNNGFIVPRKEILLLTKQKAYGGRKMSIKGQKDLIDIISILFQKDFDFGYYKKWGSSLYSKELIRLLETTYEIEELNLNKHSFAKKKKEVLDKLQ